MSEKLQDIARALVAPGKGILAADESSGTIKKRFDTIKLTSTEDVAYARELADKGLVAIAAQPLPR